MHSSYGSVPIVQMPFMPSPLSCGYPLLFDLHLSLTLMRVTDSYLYEGIVAAAIEPSAADHDGISYIPGVLLFE